MKKAPKIVAYCIIPAVVAVAIAVAAYIARNLTEAPDFSRFINKFEVPSNADNVYCGLAEAASVADEATGVPIIETIFGQHWDAIVNYAAGEDKDDTQREISREEIDTILAETEKVRVLFHEAVHRKTWHECDLPETSAPKAVTDDLIPTKTIENCGTIISQSRLCSQPNSAI